MTELNTLLVQKQVNEESLNEVNQKIRDMYYSNLEQSGIEKFSKEYFEQAIEDFDITCSGYSVKYDIWENTHNGEDSQVDYDVSVDLIVGFGEFQITMNFKDRTYKSNYECGGQTFECEIETVDETIIRESYTAPFQHYIWDEQWTEYEGIKELFETLTASTFDKIDAEIEELKLENEIDYIDLEIHEDYLDSEASGDEDGFLETTVDVNFVMYVYYKNESYSVARFSGCWLISEKDNFNNFKLDNNYSFTWSGQWNDGIEWVHDTRPDNKQFELDEYDIYKVLEENDELIRKAVWRNAMKRFNHVRI